MEIKPYEKNAKKHPDKQLKLIANSISAFGCKQPIVVDKDGVIIAGHGRYLAMTKILGWHELKEEPKSNKGDTFIPYILADELTNDEIKAYRLADNKLNESEWDMSLALGELKELSIDLQELTGFNLDLLVEPDEKDDIIPEAPEEPKSNKGDLYELGDHRVLCGDSITHDDVEKLMNGRLSDMIHTDPPYNVDYGANKHHPSWKIRSIENDKLDPKAWEDFCKALYANFQTFNKGDIYMWGASGVEGMKMRLWLTEMGCHWSTTIIWKKDRLVLSPANYQRMYEPCFYGWFGKSTWQGSRKETEVWEEKRPTTSKLHPTMKPIEICSRAIINSSKERDIVLDLFLGSGSTLIASEKTKRTCYGIEIDPHYVDVIVQRWVDYTGITKIKRNGEEIEWKVTKPEMAK